MNHEAKSKALQYHNSQVFNHDIFFLQVCYFFLQLHVKIQLAFTCPEYALSEIDDIAACLVCERNYLGSLII